MYLYIFKYNNYYNRIYKKYQTLVEYQENADLVYYLSGVNFNPNDGVNTTHTIGQNGGPSNDFRAYSGEGDYVIITDSDNTIKSRWFIIEANRLMGGQYRIDLRRDLIADYSNQIFNATTFVEKGNVGQQNPLIYNLENMNLNKIKTSETLLKDSTECPWIVGYIPRNLEVKTNTFTPLITPDYKLDMDLVDWEYADYITTDFRCYPEKTSSIQFVFTQTTFTEQKFINFSIDGNMWSSWNTGAFLNGIFYNTTGGPFAPGYPPNNTARAYFPPSLIKEYFDITILSYIGYKTEAQTQELLNYKDKIIQFNDGIYRISFDNKTWRSTSALHFGPDKQLDAIFNRLKSWAFSAQESGQWATYGGYSGAGGNLDATGASIRLIATKISNVDEQSYTWTIPGASSRAHLQDAPYDMFCLPYGELNIQDNEKNIKTSGSLNLSVANDIISSLVVSQAGEIYDVQLLPYCPLREEVRIGTDILLSNFKNNNYYSAITQQDETVGYIFFADSSSFSAQIPFEVNIENPKIEANTDTYRLSSPNYNGQFEFNAAMNKGISYFTAECTYLPFTPYIHVKPDFKGLYGAENFNDARGLICGGDFSLPIISDAWNQYKLQNKNYQEIFDRQIQNMNVQHEVARVQEVFNVVGGTAQGAMSGAMTGAKMSGGNPYAAIAGGVVGGVSSMVGGLADMAINERLRSEAIDYTRDQFQYNLGNIQALPNSLTKITAYNINNRIFPVLEYYTCTDEEKIILANKIAYNGMTINAIGRLIDYIQDWKYNNIESKRYIKGKIINITINDEFHLASNISDEVYKGFFVSEEVFNRELVEA